MLSGTVMSFASLLASHAVPLNGSKDDKPSVEDLEAAKTGCLSGLGLDGVLGSLPKVAIDASTLQLGHNQLCTLPDEACIPSLWWSLSDARLSAF